MNSSVSHSITEFEEAYASNSITASEEAYLRQLKHPEVKKALHRLDSAQARHDSVSRHLAMGSSGVSLDDLSCLESELVAAKAGLVKLLIWGYEPVELKPD